MRTMAHEFQICADEIDIDNLDFAMGALQQLGNFQEMCEELQVSVHHPKKWISYSG